MAYMERNIDIRLNPTLLVQGVKTIVSTALSYKPTTPIPDDKLQLAWYAYGHDYHDIVKQKLTQLLNTLKHLWPVDGRAFCDSAPILERYWAWRSGLGWIGKHTQLVIPRCGSAFFLGELFLTLPADHYDTPLHNQCGKCTRCLDACPTKALTTQNGLDAHKCLSYLTIENRGEIPNEAAQKMYPYFYGCDRCMRACPHLTKKAPDADEALKPNPEILNMNEEDWLKLNIQQYQTLFKGSAVKRAKFQGLERNLNAIRKNKKNKN